MRRDGVRDDQWARIQDLLPGRVGHIGRTAKDNRLFVEAVLDRFRTGVPWRDLPERFGCGEFVARIGWLASGDGWRKWTTPSVTLDPPCRSRPMLIAATISRNSGAG